MPVVDFYIKGLTNEERGRVSFVCTCTLKEDMDRVSKELNLNLDTDTWISWGSLRDLLGITTSRLSTCPCYRTFLVEVFNSSLPAGMAKVVRCRKDGTFRGVVLCAVRL